MAGRNTKRGVVDPNDAALIQENSIAQPETQTEEPELDDRGRPLSGGDLRAQEERKFAEEHTSGGFDEADLSTATKEGVKDEVAREEYRKATELQRTEEIQNAKAEEAEADPVQSTASVDQYQGTLAELREASNDPHLSYNARLEARMKADILQDVINDMNGEGRPNSTTLPSDQRATVDRVPTL